MAHHPAVWQGLLNDFRNGAAKYGDSGWHLAASPISGEHVNWERREPNFCDGAVEDGPWKEPLQVVLDRLDDVVPRGDEFEARWLLECQAGCDAGPIVEAIRLQLRELFPKQRTRPSHYPPADEYELIGVCELPGIEGFPSEAYGMYAACGPEVAEALEAFRPLANQAGEHLPAVIRDVLPPCPSTGPFRLWVRFLWFFGLSFTSDLKLEQHFALISKGRFFSKREGWIGMGGFLSTREGWTSPFRSSWRAIEACRLHTDSPVFYGLDKIPGLVKRPVPAVPEGARTPSASPSEAEIGRVRAIVEKKPRAKRDAIQSELKRLHGHKMNNAKLTLILDDLRSEGTYKVPPRRRPPATA